MLEVLILKDIYGFMTQPVYNTNGAEHLLLEISFKVL